jgi:hypothetical protein
VAGQVIDAQTGVSVSGAEVFSSHSVQYGTRGEQVGTRWTTTDEDGHFSVPGKLALYDLPFFAEVSRYPRIVVVHLDYGIFTFSYGAATIESDFSGWDQLEYKIQPDDTRTLFKEPRPYSLLCGSIDYDGCFHLCTVTSSNPEDCRKPGGSR